jgi:hypothetical protein
MSNISTTGFRSTAESSAFNFPAAKNIDTQLIRCDIVFGMPSQDCRGTGICKLSSEFHLSSTKKECRHTIAFASKGEGVLSLLFFRPLLCVELFRRQFRKGIFEMPESCPLDQHLKMALGLSGSTLLPGKYTITQQGDCFRVDIPYA